MGSSTASCVLSCIENLHKTITLPHDVPVYIGRSRETNITDKNCSKQQVKLIADINNQTVQATPLGVNYSGLNGYCLVKNKTYTLKDKDRLEILLNKHIYEICFQDSNSCKTKPDDDDNCSKKKRSADEIVMPDKNKKHKDDSVQGSTTVFGWEEIDEKAMLIYTSENVRSSTKIASFDMDGTIIRTKSGAVFAKDMNDWQINFSEVSTKLKKLHQEDGYKIVFFTNQAGIGRGKVRASDMKQKVENIVKRLQVPVQVFISTGKGIYRKPIPGMWVALCKQKNEGLTVDLNNSFYVGDAAGREANWAPKKKKDHSLVDRLFALNIGLKFYTPEEYFLGARKVPFKMPEFDPTKVANLPLSDPEDATLIADESEVVLMVGFPGSGKSHFARNILGENGYRYVNRDTLGTWQKCVSAMEDALKKKERVVIDNTNPDKATREKYITAVRKYKVPCRAFVMNTTYHQSKHNNVFRELTDKTHVPVNDMVINSYKTKYEEPNLMEGFAEIVRINFLPQFDNSEHQQLYNMYLLEK